MKWTTTQLIAAGAMGALLAMVATLEIPLNILIMPGVGGIMGGFFEIVVFSAAMLLIPRFGTGAIVAGVALSLLLPVPVFGPAGFLPKVAYGFGFGFLFDIFWLFFKRFGKWGLALTGSLITAFSSAAFIVLASLFNLKGISDSLWLVTVMTLIFVALVVAGSLVAWHAFQKLKNTAVVRRIQES